MSLGDRSGLLLRFERDTFWFWLGFFTFLVIILLQIIVEHEALDPLLFLPLDLLLIFHRNCKGRIGR